MKQQRFFAMCVAVISIAACSSNKASSDEYPQVIPPAVAVGAQDPAVPFRLPVSLEVVGEKRGYLTNYPLNYDPMSYRAYIQAKPNERYSLRVQNNTGERVGVVIAVDGRNIISGEQSYLQHNERKYIINPFESANYEGWRTGSNKTNRFYFTKVKDSYAAAWGDTSAMGVIAMAVYPEKARPQVYEAEPTPAADAAAEAKAKVTMRSSRMERSAPAPAADAAAAAPAAPGTGFGEMTYSPSVVVAFEPSEYPMEKVFLKYEWHKTLCQKHVLPECMPTPPPPPVNRMWQDDEPGYAPPPPAR